MLKKILFNFPNFGNDQLFNESVRDACLDSFIFLRKRLRERGYLLETTDDRTTDDKNVEDYDQVWFWDLLSVFEPKPSAPRNLREGAKYLIKILKKPAITSRLLQKCLKAKRDIKQVLFLAEPPAVFLPNWDRRLHALFPIILTWDDGYVDGKKYHKFNWPITGQFPDVTPIAFEQKKLLVNISSNKFSDHPEELYSARRKTIRYFEQHHPESFELYGIGWDQPGPGENFYPSYRGTIPHKWDVFPRYRFAICYENQCAPGWITEKIFDCMRADCVPIYWGAPNIADFVNPDTFIDRTHFPSEETLAAHLFSLDEKRYSKYREAIKDYLASSRFKAFLPEAFANNIIKTLSL